MGLAARRSMKPRLDRDFLYQIARTIFDGTPSELVSLIGSQGQGIPTTAVWLSIEVMKTHITDALKNYGITVERKRTESKRLLQVRSITQ